MPLKRARLKISDYKDSRKNKNAEKQKKVMAVSLSLTSMVDMFAILVIFLLTNQTTVEEWVQIEHEIALPQAKSSDETRKATAIQIATDQVWVDGNKSIAEVSKITSGPLIIAPLRAYLMGLKEKGGYVNIVGDERVPFGAIRRIIATSQDAGFANVNLAVMPK